MGGVSRSIGHRAHGASNRELRRQWANARGEALNESFIETECSFSTRDCFIFYYTISPVAAW